MIEFPFAVISVCEYIKDRSENLSGVRIYELSKELGVANKVIIETATKMGYPVKSHSSSIDNMLADRLRRQVQKMDAPKAKAKKKASAKSAKPVKAAKPAKAKPTKAKAVKEEVEDKPEPAEKKTAKATKPEKVSAAKPAKKVAKPEIEEVKKSVKETAVTLEPEVEEAPKPKELTEEEKKREERRRFLEDQRIREAVERKAKEITERKKRESERKRRKEDDRKRKSRRVVESKLQKETEQKRRIEAEIRRTQEAEERKIKSAADEVLRKKRVEEAEIQRLIDEEEAVKREAESRRIVIDEATTVREFAEKLSMGVNEIIKALLMKGVMANLNQTIDVDMAKEMAVELGYELVTAEENEIEEIVEETESEENLTSRPPVVTIMGHVDHGKTSLLDTIRKTRVTDSEAGGITQSIGAYTVKLPSKGSVTFVDTPGHEAFTAMRSRGAAVTDIVVLVVAADDGVMPQTVEAIHHSKAAGVPVLVAVNKIDKPGANPDKVKQELANHELIPEDWGGSTIFCDVSAKENIGIEHLLEMLLLQSEMLELTANHDREAFGTIVESKLDKGRGPVATILVQKGSLKVGDPFVAGSFSGKVRALLDDKGGRIDIAGPSIPVEVLGFSGVPNAGENFMVVENERKATQIASARQDKQRIDGLTDQSKGHVKLESLHAQITKGEVRDLNIIVKADVQGSIEAVSKALSDIQAETVRIRVLHGAVGGITETDVSLAHASDAIIIGFNVRPTEKARALADQEEVDIRFYSIIYNAIDDIKAALEGMLEPEYKENVTGRVEVRETFNIGKIGTIAGCMVTSGKIVRNGDARLLRDNVVIHTGKVTSLKRFKDDAKEVASGYECGMGLERYNDIKVGDVIEAFELEQVVQKL